MRRYIVNCMNLTYKYRLYLNKEQAVILQKNFNFCNFLYNSALQERITFYKKYGVGRSYNEQSVQLPEIKKMFAEQTSSIYSQSFQQVLKRVDSGFKNFFRRVKEKADKVGFPRYKPQDRFRSIVFPQSDLKGGGVKLLENGKLKIFGIPEEVKVKMHRPFQGRCKLVSIIKKADKFYIALSCDEVPLEPLAKTGKTIGIDVGLISFITTDDGTSFHHPKPYKTAKEKLAYLNRKLAAKQRGSNNRRRAKRSLARAYEKVSNVREDFLHKISQKLVEENDTIIIEKLNVKGMLEQAKPAPTFDSNGKKVFKAVAKKENIQDASWGSFAAMLSYKAERAGKMLIEVPPKNTSKMCSCCGNIDTEQTLKDRVYNCKACGFAMDRDQNAAINIKWLGMSLVAAKEKTASEASIL